MKKIYIKENKIKLLKEEKDVFNWGKYFSNLKRIDESINNYLLTESQESKSISAAKKLLMQKLRYNEQQADEFVRVKLRNDLPVLRTPEGGKFILGVTRMFIDGELSNSNQINNLNSTLKLVASDAHINEYDRNLNGMTSNDLISRFAQAISDNLNAEKEEINQMVFDTPSDYEIVRIDSFEQAKQYGRYTSWCVTHYQRMFDSYTSDGIKQFYFCLKNGFENVKQIEGDGCPLDEYGLSMIAISVNEHGMLSTCTCRWNHSNGGNDNIMNSKEISQVIGMNFFEVFKPNNKFKELISNAVQRLNNGEDPREVFDECYSFVNGFSRVVLNKKENFINQNYELLSNQWFDNSYSFSNGFGIVMLNGKWNYINQNGELLSPNQWFDECSKFKNGIANVRLNGKYNFINQNGELLSPNQWFDGCDSFIYDFNFVQVILNNKYNFINKYGKLLSPNQWFDKCGYFKDGIVKVGINGKLNFINQNGELLSPNQWFDECSNFENGFASIKVNNQYNFINQNGELLSPNQWFDGCSYFKDGVCPILLNGKINWVKETGELLYPNQLFDFTYNEKDEIGVVNINGQKCFINNDGHIIDDVNENTNKQKKIYINESQLTLLTESQESKSISAAKKLLIQRLGYDEQQADEFVRIKLRNDLPVLRTPEGGKFILGVTRMFIDGELSSANDIGNLNSTLKLVASDAHINEYDRNLNGMSANELINRFAQAMSDNLNAEKEEVNQMIFDTPSDYEIVRIDSFEQAQQYGKYTSWCVTHDEDMFNSYTSDGISQFYFCLKNGFENVKQIEGEGCPLDEYGLSMIAISVNENGMLNTCTCRWNHDNGGNDNIMNTKEISQVIGMNFFNVFKPNNTWIDLVDKSMKRLNAGEPIYEVFDDYYEYDDGITEVELKGKCNFINANGEILSPNQWYDHCDCFYNDFAIVRLKNKYNFINVNGKLLSPNQWFDECYDFYNGFATVRLKNKYNFINANGKLLSPKQWFDGYEHCSNGFAIVELDGRFNFINEKGKILTPNQWYDDCYDFHNGFAIVELDGRFNFINEKGKILTPNQWYDRCADFENGVSIVRLNDKLYYINNEGKKIGKIN